MQHRPDIILAHLTFGHACAGRQLYGAHRCLAGMAGAAHGLDFVWSFDDTGFLGQLFTFHYLKI